jgi:hypothetical protein
MVVTARRSWMLRVGISPGMARGRDLQSLRTVRSYYCAKIGKNARDNSMPTLFARSRMGSGTAVQDSRNLCVLVPAIGPQVWGWLQGVTDLSNLV